MRMTTRNQTVRLLALLFSALALFPGAAVTESFVAERRVGTGGYAINTPVGFDLLKDGAARGAGERKPAFGWAEGSEPSTNSAPPYPSAVKPNFVPGECTTIAHCGQSDFTLPDGAGYAPLGASELTVVAASLPAKST
jgi:hypothetical protein